MPRKGFFPPKSEVVLKIIFFFPWKADTENAEKICSNILSNFYKLIPRKKKEHYMKKAFIKFQFFNL